MRKLPTIRIAKGLLVNWRKELKDEAQSLGLGKFQRFRKPLLWAIDAKNDRINGSDYTEWDGTVRQILGLVELYPEAVEVVADLALECHEDFRDMLNGNGESTLVYGGGPLWSQSIAGAMSVTDADWRKNTGFNSLASCLGSHPRYRPSMDMREPIMRRMADRYDLEMAAMGNPKRAYRYGGM